MLAALAHELAPLAAEMQPLGRALSEGDEEAAAQYLALLERLASVGELLDLPALNDLSMHLLANVPAQLGQSEQADLASGWLPKLEAVLRDPQDDPSHHALLLCLTDERWPEPLSEDQAHEILQQILSCDVDMQERRQPRQYGESDLTLQIQNDVTAEILQAFRHEAPHYAQMLNQHLSNLRYAGELVDTLNSARRAAHTLKGSAALIGAQAIVTLTHLLEELLAQLQSHPEQLSGTLLDDLAESGDVLEELIEHVLVAGDSPSGAPIATLLGRLDQWAVTLDQSTSDKSPVEKPSGEKGAGQKDLGEKSITAAQVRESSASYSPTAAEPEVDPEADGSDAESLEHDTLDSDQAAAPALESTGSSETTLTVPISMIDNMLRSTGELMIQVGHLQTLLRSNIDRSNQLGQHLLGMQQLVHELENQIDVYGTPAMRQAVANAVEAVFDPLELDQYNVLHSLSRGFAENALDAREMSREINESLLGMQNQLLHQQRLGREVNSAIMAARMVRVATLEPRWQRIVRQACRATGKQVELSLRGGDVAIDTDILNALIEPLLHLLRNAVDHGIESPAEREALNKAARGRIELAFRQDGSRIEVLLKDDGRGLDSAAIAEEARERGLTGERQSVDSTSLIEWIQLPGFTTRKAASEVSGRGIGLDAVRAAVQSLGGVLSLHSDPGAGLTVRLILPQSLSSAHMLFVQVGEQMFGLPSLAVSQVVFSDAGEIERLADDWILRFAGNEQPIYRLADLLGLEGEVRLEQLDPPRPLVIMDQGGQQIALLVDSVVDTREVVIKSLNHLLPNLQGVSGATILADGGLALILDLSRLSHTARLSQAPVSPGMATKPQPIAALPSVMIVDDSLSARRSLSALVQDLGYRPVTAIDGIDAVEKLSTTPVQAMLVDLEMPRMNGLELTTHVRLQDDYRNLPVIMVTSRSTSRHRQQAERAGVNTYLTKPYEEETLAELLHRYIAGVEMEGR